LLAITEVRCLLNTNIHVRDVAIILVHPVTCHVCNCEIALVACTENHVLVERFSIAPPNVDTDKTRIGIRIYNNSIERISILQGQLDSYHSVIVHSHIPDFNSNRVTPCVTYSLQILSEIRQRFAINFASSFHFEITNQARFGTAKNLVVGCVSAVVITNQRFSPELGFENSLVGHEISLARGWGRRRLQRWETGGSPGGTTAWGCRRQFTRLPRGKLRWQLRWQVAWQL
jgi:hypothetical protein